MSINCQLRASQQVKECPTDKAMGSHGLHSLEIFCRIPESSKTYF